MIRTAYAYLLKRLQFVIGIVISSIVLFSLLYSVGTKSWVEKVGIDRHYYSMLTGFLLIVFLFWQWRLFVIRRNANKKNLAFELTSHKWVGSLMVVGLFVHAGSLGVSMQAMISVLFFAVIFSGLFHLEFFQTRFPLTKRLWDVIHLGLAAFMFPLVAIHIWVAFAYYY